MGSVSEGQCPLNTGPDPSGWSPSSLFNMEAAQHGAESLQGLQLPVIPGSPAAPVAPATAATIAASSNTAQLAVQAPSQPDADAHEQLAATSPAQPISVPPPTASTGAMSAAALMSGLLTLPQQQPFTHPVQAADPVAAVLGAGSLAYSLTASAAGGCP